MEKKLLEGIRVVDITVYLTGPLTTKALSDCGAEVIQIGTRSRQIGGQTTDARAGSAQQYNTGKLSITLNFASPKGLELAHRLISKADIVVENLSGGTLKRRGLGYDDLKKIKPDIIMLSTCMQGQTGPYAEHPGSGHKLTGLSGFNHIFGWPDRPPEWINAYTDFIAPRYNVIAILAALEYRKRTGKGQYLDMSQYESSIQFMSPLILDYNVNGRVANRMGNECSYAAPHNAYRCLGEDRWCAISVFTDEEWQSFCRVIEKPELTNDPRFSSLLARKENEEELDKIINGWTTNHSPWFVMMMMQEAGVAAGVVETAEDQMDKDPQFKHRHFFWELEHPVIGKYRSPAGAHYLLSKSPYELERSPVMGEHNDYVYKGILGMSDEEIADLVNEGVIG